MLPHARVFLAVALIGTALAGAGCGSSSSSKADAAPAATAAAKTPATTTTTTPAQATGPRPTKAAYVRRADGVCRHAQAISQSANSAIRRAFAAKDPNKAADAIDKFRPHFAARITELKALRRPAADAHVLEGLMKVMDIQVQALVAESTALRMKDNAQLQRIAQTQQQEQQYAETLGMAYGFKVCGRAA